MAEMNQKLLILIGNGLKISQASNHDILSPSKAQQPLAIDHIIFPRYVNFIDLWDDCMA